LVGEGVRLSDYDLLNVFSGNRSSARLGRGDCMGGCIAKKFEATKTAFFLARWKDWQQRGLSRIWWLYVPAVHDLTNLG
jgi:hypothetical protein